MKKILTVLMVLIFNVGIGSFSCCAQSFSIRNNEDFVDFVEQVNEGNSFKGDTVRLKTNINISDIYEDGRFVSIGNCQRPFCGIFNGKRHFINLEIQAPEQSFVGLFAHTRGATFYNLNIIGRVFGKQEVGSFVGRAFNTNFYNCSSDVSVCGRRYVGGFVGLSRNVYFNLCCNLGDVLCSRGLVGAFSGYCRCDSVSGNGTERLVDCRNLGELEVDLVKLQMIMYESGLYTGSSLGL